MAFLYKPFVDSSLLSIADAGGVTIRNRNRMDGVGVV